MKTADFIVIGGGIAGLSAASRLASHGKVVVCEAENAVGYHSSGRSATYYHFGIGNNPVRAMTSYSRAFFEDPPEGFADRPLCRPTPALFIAREDMVDSLNALEAQMRRFTDMISRATEADMRAMLPVLKVGEGAVVAGVIDNGGRRLDADGLLQGFAKQVKVQGGEVLTDHNVAALTRLNGVWEVTTQRGEKLGAPIVINAAGAWADKIGALAGAHPLGLQPKRRTVILFDPPEEIDIVNWPFVKTAVDDFYMIPESGRLRASPVDEIDSEPTDAQPEDYDLALAAWKVEDYTTLTVPRIGHRWAGLRSFVADRVPTAGFAPDVEGFFWLAGQGGYGLQTAPAMADIVASLITGSPWPHQLEALGLTRNQIAPERLF
jgi:D-arginine dehydrogenase